MAIDAAEIERVTDVMRSLAARDVADLDRAQLKAVMAAAATLERVVGAFGSRLAGEVKRLSDPSLPGGGFARREGFGDPGGLIAKVRGGTESGAKRAIDAGDAFTPRTVPTPGAREGDGGAPATVVQKYPVVARACVEGSLSVDAAGLIVRGRNDVSEKVSPAVLVDMERRLVDRARDRSARDVQRMVARAVARVDRAELHERQRRHHAERYFTWKEDHTGMVRFHGTMDAATAAPLMTAIEQMVTHEFRARRDGGRASSGAGVGQDAGGPGGAESGAGAHQRSTDLRSAGQMRADALFALARHALGCSETEASGVRTSLVVRMGVEDLKRLLGGDTEGAAGAIDGVNTPVPLEQLRRLAGDAGVIPEVLGRDGEVLELGRRVRLFSRAQRVALLERDGGCAKCHAPPEHCEAHHITWWEHGGRTDLSNGVMLCTRCHHDVHRQGWGIRASGSRVEFVPPRTIDPERRPRLGGARALEIWDDAAPGTQHERSAVAPGRRKRRVPNAGSRMAASWEQPGMTVSMPSPRRNTDAAGLAPMPGLPRGLCGYAASVHGPCGIRVVAGRRHVAPRYG
ncbi:HNH endonuclease signature motif containing protein [Demequina globuliformis]|uniref:HNH endonuclease signature motif containing protein n=1 Tax=Demequina globuliformis TaxID=676202 RepID=UPI000783E69C|nr:HNH endonuclease signature motif containing protein [Demequina globuliformis]